MLSTTATIDFAIEVFRVLSTIAVWSPVALFAVIAVKQTLKSSVVNETVKPFQPKIPKTKTPLVKKTETPKTPVVKTPQTETFKTLAAVNKKTRKTPSKQVKRPTVTQLRSQAKNRGLKGYSKASKAQLEKMLA